MTKIKISVEVNEAYFPSITITPSAAIVSSVVSGVSVVSTIVSAIPSISISLRVGALTYGFISFMLGNGMNNTSGVSVVSVRGGNGGGGISHRCGISHGGSMSIGVVRAGVSSIAIIRVSVGKSMAVDAGVEDGRVGFSLSLRFSFSFGIALPVSVSVSGVSIVSTPSKTVVSAVGTIVSGMTVTVV